MKKYFLILPLVLFFTAAKSQKRQVYFGLGPEVQFTGVDNYSSAVGVGAAGQLSYWLNDKFVLIANTGLMVFMNGSNADKYSIPDNYYIIPLLAGMEYNFSKTVFMQVQAGNSFAKNVRRVNNVQKRETEVNNALTYNLSLGVRLSPHSDILFKANHIRFNNEKRSAVANNNSIGFAYMYNL